MSETSDLQAILDEEKGVTAMEDTAPLARWEEIRHKAQETSETPYTASEEEDATVPAFWARLQAIEYEPARRWRKTIRANKPKGADF